MATENAPNSSDESVRAIHAVKRKFDPLEANCEARYQVGRVRALRITGVSGPQRRGNGSEESQREQPLTVWRLWALFTLVVTAIGLVNWKAYRGELPYQKTDSIANIDKIAHVVAYFSLTVTVLLLVGAYARRARPLVVVAVVTIPMAALAAVEEMAQVSSEVRSLDAVDFLASVIGIVLGCLAGLGLSLLARPRPRLEKGPD